MTTDAGKAGRRLRDRLRVAVVTTTLRHGANELWEAASAHGADVLVVGPDRRGSETPASAPNAVALPEFDFGRGLIWRHLEGLRETLRRYNPDLIHVNGELWSVTVQEVVGLSRPVVAHGAENLWSHGHRVEQA